jgi:hypothetical protein
MDGYVEGTIDWKGAPLRVRRVDADANGQFADPLDLVWLDLDRDQSWNEFTERFRFQPIFRLDQVAHQCGADQRGHRFSISPLTATGKIGLVVPAEMRSRGLIQLSVVLAGRSGSILHLALPGDSADVPADDYRPINVIARFQRDEQPREWTFVFIAWNSESEPTWTKVPPDGAASINPLRELQFSCTLNRSDATYAAGSYFVVTPRFRTADGLQIQTAYTGREQTSSFGELKAVVNTIDPISRKGLGTVTCGFT